MRRSKPTRPSSRRCTSRLPSAFAYSGLEQRRLLFGDFDFASTLGNTVASSAQDSQGNIFVSGYLNSGLQDFDPGPGTFNLDGNQGHSFVVKLDPVGQFVWARQYGTNVALANPHLATDAAGNVLLAGGFSNTLDFDPGAATASLTSVGGDDAFIASWDGDGNFRWARIIGGTGDDEFTTLATDASGNIVLGGTTRSTDLDFDPGAGTVLYVAASTTADDAILLKLDSDGNYVWSAGWGGTGDDEVGDIAIDGTRNVFLAGRFEGAVDFDSSSASYLLNGSGIDAFVGRWDANGTLVWAHGWGGFNLDDARTVALGPGGQVVVSGGFLNASVDFDPGPGTRILTTVGSNDGYLSSFDDQGNFQWAGSYGGVNNEGPLDLLFDHQRRIVVAGYFEGTCDFNPGPLVSNLTNLNDRAAFVMILNSSGHFLWATGMSATDASSGIHTGYGGPRLVADAQDNLYLTGAFYGTVDFSSGQGTGLLTSAAAHDGFFVRLSSSFIVDTTLASGSELILRKNGFRLEAYDPAANVVIDSRIIAQIEGVEVRGVDGAIDQLTVDFKSGGAFGFRDGIRFHAGTGAGDIFNLVSSANESFNYRPAATANGETMLVDAGGEIRMTGVESIAVIDLAQLTVTTQNSLDLLTVAAVSGIGGTAATGVSGTSGGVAIVPLSWIYVPAVLIDTGRRDLIGPPANDTVTVNAGALQANGLRDLEFSLGRGADIVYTNDADLGLPEAGGQFLVRGGAGVDRVSVTGNADWWINDLRVTSSSGGQINFDGIERATVIAGAGNNTITAVGFFGPMILQGLDGQDTIWGGSYADTISGGNGNDHLYGMDGDDSLDGQANVDRIFGGNGNDTLNGAADIDWLFGGDGDDTLLGGFGADLLNGQAGNDTLNGEGGLDLVWFEGTNNAEHLHLQLVSPTSASRVRRPRGLAFELERDRITMDSTDQFLIQALDGDDLITIDLGFANLGSVDGGNDVDICTAPASWTKTSCP